MEVTFAVREAIGGVLSSSARAAATQLARGTQLIKTHQSDPYSGFPISAAELLEMLDFNLPEVPHADELAAASDPSALHSTLVRLAAAADVVGNLLHLYVQFVVNDYISAEDEAEDVAENNTSAAAIRASAS